MITEETIEGRPALVTWMTEDQSVVDDKDKATFIRVRFTDDEGGSMFLFKNMKAKDTHIPLRDEPRTLYVYRPVLNGEELLGWARKQGFKTLMSADQLHATVTFSRAPVLWSSIRMNHLHMHIMPSRDLVVEAEIAPRRIERLGPDAVVLLFTCAELESRHHEMRRLGASWDWPSFRPHVTLTYDPGDVYLSRIEPYSGRLVFGPEVFEEINEDWKDQIGVARSS